jgi:hypothetical protein
MASSSYVRGALVELTTPSFIPVPNVIIFQYNPETIDHTWTPGAAPQTDSTTVTGNPLAIPGMPGESFSFTLVMDANDQIGQGNPLATSSGLYSRLAALEMLLYPTGSGTASLVGQVSANLSAGSATIGVSLSLTAGANAAVPVSQLPMVLFIWGVGRIVPVRVKGLTIKETIYDTSLNPIHAEAQIQLSVLTPQELANLTGATAVIANAAYAYSQGLRQTLAALNLANSAQSMIAMIP